MNQSKIEDLTKLQHEALELKVKFENKMQEYKANTKALIGICDGEQTSVLDLYKMVSKVVADAVTDLKAEYLEAIRSVGEAHVAALLAVKQELAAAVSQSCKETQALQEAKAEEAAQTIVDTATTLILPEAVASDAPAAPVVTEEAPK